MITTRLNYFYSQAWYSCSCIALILVWPDEIFDWKCYSWNGSDANKSVFDWCKEGNVKRMDVLLNKGENINAKDEQVSNFDCFKIWFLSCKLSWLLCSQCYWESPCMTSPSKAASLVFQLLEDSRLTLNQWRQECVLSGYCILVRNTTKPQLFFSLFRNMIWVKRLTGVKNMHSGCADHTCQWLGQISAFFSGIWLVTWLKCMVFSQCM